MLSAYGFHMPHRHSPLALVERRKRAAARGFSAARYEDESGSPSQPSSCRSANSRVVLHLDEVIPEVQALDRVDRPVLRLDRLLPDLSLRGIWIPIAAASIVGTFDVCAACSSATPESVELIDTCAGITKSVSGIWLPCVQRLLCIDDVCLPWPRASPILVDTL